MNALMKLSGLALRPVLGDGAEAVVGFLADRVSDRSQRLIHKLHEASGKAWRTVEVTLAGPSWWDRAKQALATAEEKAFRRQMENFLGQAAAVEIPGTGPTFRHTCLVELRGARRAGMVPGAPPAADALTAQARELAKYANPEAALAAEWRALHGLGMELEGAGFHNLGKFVAWQPPTGTPLLVVAVRYFFRREVEEDEDLAQRLTFQQLDHLSQAQEAGFRDLHAALTTHGDKLDQLLGLLEAVRDTVEATHDDVRAMRAQLERLTALVEQQARLPVVSPPPVAPPAKPQAAEPPPVPLAASPPIPPGGGAPRLRAVGKPLSPLFNPAPTSEPLAASPPPEPPAPPDPSPPAPPSGKDHRLIRRQGVPDLFTRPPAPDKKKDGPGA